MMLYADLEPKRPLFLKVNPQNKAFSPIKSFGFQVYIILLFIAFFLGLSENHGLPAKYLIVAIYIPMETAHKTCIYDAYGAI